MTTQLDFLTHSGTAPRFPVYVDAPIWPLGKMIMCHMICEDLEELHAMADKIGLSRRHFQARHRLPHYDVCKAKRSLAIGFGAVEIDRKQFVEISRRITAASAITKDSQGPGFSTVLKDWLKGHNR